MSSFGAFFSTCYPTASTASAATAFAVIDTDKKNCNTAANSWAWPLPIQPLLPQNHRKDYRDRYEELTGVSLRLCPVCRRGRMIRMEVPSTVACTSPTLRDTS
jgi:hypothetical protein